MQKYICYTIVLAVLCLGTVTKTYSTATITPLELKPTSIDGSYKTAATHWLPDYLGGDNSFSDVKANERKRTCEERGYKSEQPSGLVCEKVRTDLLEQTGQLEQQVCYKNCVCDASKYIYTKGKGVVGGCPNGQTTNSDCCRNKCSGCVNCPGLSGMASTGWKATKPSISTAYATDYGTCYDAYFDCGPKSSGAKVADLIPGVNVKDSRAWKWSSDCRSYQKVVNKDGSSTTPFLCQKCIAKSCADYNSAYTDNIPSGKKCTQVSTTFFNNMTCYTNCVNKSCADYNPTYTEQSSLPGKLCSKVATALVDNKTCYACEKDCTAPAGYTKTKPVIEYPDNYDYRPNVFVATKTTPFTISEKEVCETTYYKVETNCQTDDMLAVRKTVNKAREDDGLSIFDHTYQVTTEEEVQSIGDNQLQLGGGKICTNLKFWNSIFIEGSNDGCIFCTAAEPECSPIPGYVEVAYDPITFYKRNCIDGKKYNCLSKVCESCEVACGRMLHSPTPETTSNCLRGCENNTRYH